MATSHDLELDQDSGVQHTMTTPKQLVNNAGHWKARAAEARQLAAAETDEVTKRALLDLAAEFDKLAERAEHRQQAKS
jgi:hypothetical protein